MSTDSGGPDPRAAVSAPAPQGRASWSGLLQFCLVAVPVKAYTAVSTTEGIHCNQLHADCGQRIRHEKRCPIHGPVDAAVIQRGYQYAPDQYVVVEPTEWDKLRPVQDRALLLEQFVASRQIDPVLLAGRSWYLLPDGPPAQHAYGVLREAMRQRQKEALGRVVLAGHRQLVVVRAAGRWLTMHLLHYPTQVRAAPGDQPRIGIRAASAEELQLAGMLIDTASRPIDWRNYRDESADELAALIEAKIAGRPLAAQADTPVALLPLLDALKRSVAAAEATPQPTPSTAPRPRQPSRNRRTAG